MNIDIFPARGCLVVHQRSAKTPGSFALSPKLSTAGSHVLVQGARLLKNEAFAKAQALNGKQVLYSFGSQFGDIVVDLQLLLGSVEVSATQALAWKQLLEYYDQHNITSNADPLTISMPGNMAHKFYAVGITMSPPDPEFNIATATITGVIVKSKSQQ